VGWLVPDEALPPHIRALLQAAAYPGSVRGEITLVQTHISYVFLVDDEVFKLKKPVDLGFVDFTTLEKRRFDCEEEVRLNQRGCPEGVYHGVVPVVREGDTYRVLDEDDPLTLRLLKPALRNVEGGERVDIEVVDYAVHMGRLPQDRMMDVLLERDAVDFDMVGMVAGRLAELHREAAAGPEITAKGGVETHRTNWHDNLGYVRPYVGRTLSQKRFDRIEAYVASFFARETLLLRHREHDGWIRECHGDLRSDAVCFDDALPGGICIYDCIEFNEAFRYSDTGLDAAFLAMDLDYRGRSDLADLFTGLYAAAIGDKQLPLLLDFYKCYRAFVRGKVESLLLDDPAVSKEQKAGARKRARTYFKLAEDYATRHPKQRLVLVTGPSGSGKSVLAGVLAARLGCAMLSTDMLRRELFEATSEREALDEGKYAPEARGRVYDEIEAQARDFLADGRPVLIDGTYIERRQRGPIVTLAREYETRLLAVECSAPDEVVRARQQNREGQAWTTSEGRWEVYLAQKAHLEPATELPEEERIAIDTTAPFADQIEAVFSKLGT
jgi:aminoglycoside phosphotransferase family enzyme/predicted kinase